MKFKEAIKILKLNNNFTDKELRNNYLKMALETHPDKSLKDTNEEFLKISEAYQFLSANPKKTNISYNDLLEDFLDNIINKNINNQSFSNELNNKYIEITKELLLKFSKTHYSDMTNIFHKISNPNSKFTIKEIIDWFYPTTNTPHIEIIEVSLENLFNEDIFQLIYKDEEYLIPMWHHELIYNDKDNQKFKVLTKLNLPEYIDIDNYNNLIINISMPILDIIHKDKIKIKIANKEFNIPVKELKIKTIQRYVFKNKGISEINKSNIYNNKKKSNIYIDIRFNDL